MGPTVSSLALDGLTSSLPSMTLKRSVLACSPGSPGVQDFNPKTCSAGATTITTSPQDEPDGYSVPARRSKRTAARIFVLLIVALTVGFYFTVGTDVVGLGSVRGILAILATLVLIVALYFVT